MLKRIFRLQTDDSFALGTIQNDDNHKPVLVFLICKEVSCHLKKKLCHFRSEDRCLKSFGVLKSPGSHSFMWAWEMPVHNSSLWSVVREHPTVFYPHWDSTHCLPESMQFSLASWLMKWYPSWSIFPWQERRTFKPQMKWHGVPSQVWMRHLPAKCHWQEMPLENATPVWSCSPLS